MPQLKSLPDKLIINATSLLFYVATNKLRRRRVYYTAAARGRLTAKTAFFPLAEKFMGLI
jgi:hypothetical protein